MTGLTEAEIVLMLRAAGCVFAEEESRLLVAEAPSDTALESMVGRRVAGEPLEVILGWTEFCGLRIATDAGVFVPRQRTEFLVRLAASLVRPGGVVLDLCCGTAALGVAVASMVPGIELHAADVDPAAVHCARRNVGPLGQVYEGDLYAALPTRLRGRVDVLVVNAPYVPTEAIALMPPEAREHEPRTALDGGSDGVDVQRRVAADATQWLAAGGHLLIETSDQQAPTTVAVLGAVGLLTQVLRSDDFDATVVLATQPGDTPTKARKF